MNFRKGQKVLQIDYEYQAAIIGHIINIKNINIIRYNNVIQILDRVWVNVDKIIYNKKSLKLYIGQTLYIHQEKLIYLVKTNIENYY